MALMTSFIVLISVALLVLIIVSVARINAVYLYFSLAVGYVLASTLSGDTNSLLSLFSSSNTNSHLSNVKLILLAIPVIATAFFMFKSVKKKRIVINLLPTLAFIVLAVILVIPLLPNSNTDSLIKSSYWIDFTKLRDLMIELSALISLSVLFIERIGRKKFKEYNSKRYR